LKNSKYFRQVELLLSVLQLLNESQNFALKGGTAINLFLLDMPRLSVDLDLTYLPLDSRESALKAIRTEMKALAARTKEAIPSVKVQLPSSNVTAGSTLIASRADAHVKVEPNTTLRGHLLPIERRVLCEHARNLFQAHVEASVVSTAELYAGKICAALDRQHPRDLFDIKMLLETTGITVAMRQAFVVYLASHSRPMHELLTPSLVDQESIFENEFKGMSRTEVTYRELEDARSSLIRILHKELTEDERLFLLSIKKGEPQWHRLPFDNLEQLPALRWKLINIKKISKEKHAYQITKLKEALKV